MQIDFHHAVTYVCARIAGFAHNEADVIAYSAQYVDDATNEGIIQFVNGAKYSRMASAHKMIDKQNLNEAANHRAWVSFHFLPGNDNKAAGGNLDGKFIKRLVCKPDSLISHDVLEYCMKDKGKPYALHRLGITMHVFADTFAHQGFAGVQHRINEVENLTLINETVRSKGFFKKLFDSIIQKFTSKVTPLGHGPALTNPDKPYLKWSYTNGLGERIERDNTEIFMLAVNSLIGHLGKYRNEPYEIQEEDILAIQRNFKTFMEEDGEKRHKRWLVSIANGDFSFGAVELKFIAKGEGSWKYDALGTTNEKDEKMQRFPYAAEFLTSDWKLFHDALQAHYFDVAHEILPAYGICVA